MLDIYYNGNFVGSLPCYFQWDGTLTNGAQCISPYFMGFTTISNGFPKVGTDNLYIESGGKTNISDSLNTITNTKYSKLNIDVKVTDVMASVKTSKIQVLNSDKTVLREVSVTTVNRQTISIDITNIDDFYIRWICSSSSGYDHLMYIYKMWLS